MGTLKPKSPFIPEYIDCPAIHDSCKANGKPDEKYILDVISQRGNTQRQQLRQYYLKAYNKDLFEILKGEFKGDMWLTVRALMLPAAEFDARELKRAMQGLGTDESLLIEILCTRTKSQLDDIKHDYKEAHGKELWEDIQDDTSGEFRQILIELCQNKRQEEDKGDKDRAAECAKQLMGSELVGERSYFRELLVGQSFPMLRLVCEEYEKLSGHPIDEAIDRMKKVDKHYKACCHTIVKCAQNMAFYFAERLHYSMKGLGTKDKTLIRLIVSRCEVDMVDIKAEFRKAYQKTLESYITDDTSGDYRKLLLALVGSPDYLNRKMKTLSSLTD